MNGASGRRSRMTIRFLGRIRRSFLFSPTVPNLNVELQPPDLFFSLIRPNEDPRELGELQLIVLLLHMPKLVKTDATPCYCCGLDP
ncbi:unnamed protein product [Victoria cruziana]